MTNELKSIVEQVSLVTLGGGLLPSPKDPLAGFSDGVCLAFLNEHKGLNMKNVPL